MEQAKFSFYSNTLRYYEESGLEPNRVASWDFDWNKAVTIMHDMFGQKLHHPVRIMTCKMIKKWGGVYTNRSKTARLSKSRTSNTLPDMDPDWLKAFNKAGCYHQIKLAERTMDFAIGWEPLVSTTHSNGEGEKVSTVSLEQPTPMKSWKLDKFYGGDDFVRQNLAVVVAFHILAHEFTHALQNEHGLQFEDKEKHPKYGYDRDDFSNYHRKSKKEMDAESGARYYGPKLVEAYFSSKSEG